MCNLSCHNKNMLDQKNSLQKNIECITNTKCLFLLCSIVIMSFLYWTNRSLCGKIILHIAQFILDVLEKTNWPVALLIFFCIYKSSLEGILKALVEMINRIERADFKNLGLVLTSDKVPDESKRLLTRFFVNQKKEANLAALSKAVASLRSLTTSLKDRHRTLATSIINSVLDTMSNLRDVLEGIAPEKVIILENFMKELRKKSDGGIPQQNFPLIHALQLLDDECGQKNDPEEFREIIEIRKIILEKQ